MLEESIKLELNVAQLYTLFHAALPEHADFWWKMVIEEKNHAALIKSVRDSFVPAGVIPSELLASSLQDLIATNDNLAGLLERFGNTSPSAAEAFGTAVELEESAGEAHYQMFMDKKLGSRIDAVFQKLNNEDMNHAERLVNYIRDQKIMLPNN